ncbi:MAG: PD40 domain-containing protein [Acidobacteriia bacterium]|nr:PD40 domain-containing protein [Terriglobia bacterium]
MGDSGSSRAAATRRGFLRALALPLAAGIGRAETGRTVTSQARRYADPSTEFEVIRVTDPAASSYLIPASNNIFSRRGNSLLFASNYGEGIQAFTLNLKSWESRQVSEAASLDRTSLNLTPDERNLCYLDAGHLMIMAAKGGPPRTLYELASGSGTGLGMGITADGPSAIVVEKNTVLRMVHLVKGTASTIVESEGAAMEPMPRPRRASTLYRTSNGALWLAHLDGSRNTRLKTAAGGTGPARWSPDGRTILYLNFPEQQGKPHALRELNPDTGEDRLIAATSQFAQFAPNADASVFVGASQSLASPYVLLLLRVARRELTLCEHASAQPAAVNPVFSPDSQRVFFQSERHGKPAIYTMRVDKLVEKTES